MKQMGQFAGVCVLIVGWWACLTCVFGSSETESSVEPILSAAESIRAKPREISFPCSADCWRSDLDLEPSVAWLDLPTSPLQLHMPESPGVKEMLVSRTVPQFDFPLTFPLEQVLRLALPVTGAPPVDPEYPKGPIYPKHPVNFDFGIRVWLRAPGVVVIRSPRLNVSNVVLAFEDGTRQRYEDVERSEVIMAGSGEHAGKRLITVWVKAGPNFSGDGPGYGQRFELAE